MEIRVPLPGPGCFQWNMGGWFGSQLGGTVWMLVGAVAIVSHAPEVTGVWLVCFAVANAIGSWLWRRRDRLRPYPALQALLGACGVSGLMALVALHVLRPGLRGNDLADEPGAILLLLLVVISLMTGFHLMEWGAKKPRAKAEKCASPEV